METNKIQSSDLERFIRQVFYSLGFNDAESESGARVLTLADLRGVESHGVARLGGYVRLVDAGKIKPNANPYVERQSYGTATLNADSGLGLHMAGKAMHLAMELAQLHGSGWVSVCNSSHFGIAYSHITHALERGMMALALTNASPLVAPAGGKERLLGTNPICLGIPAGQYPPFVLDMATTVVANGKLEVAARKGVNIPLGYAQDAEGNPSTDPTILTQGGSMVPLGGSLAHSSYKGYGLGAAVDILSGVLSGANYGPWVPPFVPFLGNITEKQGDGIGHFVGAWQIDGFMDPQLFAQRMDTWIQRFSQSVPAAGVDRVYVPGQLENMTHAKRLETGIPIGISVWESLAALDSRFGIGIIHS
ncbi:MAG: Ldh family oxidoreductase [Bacteroidetes bacterium]|nr:Ldh family oxidoreductase [Bacteroidota bacterium]